ncbi:DUF6776 family protein [Achromobacter sp. F4_2707]|uniref:DUF6776 family protein n=1 Tax=Achromobacter sp. F4_2707 TaxID=3114286 RepID=UPI0039C60F85
MGQPTHNERTAVVVAPNTQVTTLPSKGGGRFAMGRRLALIIAMLVGAVVGGAIVFFMFERPALEAAQARAQAYEQDLAAARGKLLEANSMVAALEGRLLVEESTRRGLESVVGTLQEDLGKAQNSLAFYEQLIPPGPQGAVTIRALDFERAGPHLKYRALLMRSGSNDTPFEGSLQFVASGIAAGEEVSVPLSIATAPSTGDEPDSAAQESDAAAQEPLKLEFSDFQRSSGLLTVPAGLDLKSVTLNVLEGNVLRTSRSVDLPVED